MTTANSVLTIPPSVPYTEKVTVFGNTADCPAAPRQSSPFFLDWANVNQQSPTFEINLTNLLAALGQINALYVDNGRSHQGVYILFPDTGYRLTVPPFSRGSYPVITNTTKFYVGIFNPAAGTNDHTVIHALNWLPPAWEGDALIEASPNIVAFDPATTHSNVNINATATSWLRMKEFNLQLSGLTMGAGSNFLTTFVLQADGTTVAAANLTLFPNELVDANNLITLRSQDVAAFQWSFTWTVVSGSVTTNGTQSGILSLYADAAEPN